MDAFGLIKPHVHPGLSAIDTLVDAIADTRAVPRISFPRANPDDRRVGLKHRDRADGCHRLLVKQRPPGDPAVNRLPNTSGSRPDKYRVWVGLKSNEVCNAPAHPCRPYASGFHPRKKGGIKLCEETEWKEKEPETKRNPEILPECH